jgi:DNA-binding MarR family transcriptional regulator
MDIPGMTPEACARAVMETVPMVMRCIRTEMRRQGAPVLSVPQFRALAFLDRTPGACLSSVADHLGVATATASVIIDRLVRRGLLVRAHDPRERRRLVLTLTPAGVQHLERARSLTRSWMAELLAPLAPASLRRIAEGVDLLGGAFHRDAPRVPRPRVPAAHPGRPESADLRGWAGGGQRR